MGEPTPWGYSDSSRSIGEGITSYTTPSHGGIHLQPQQWAEFQKLFPKFECFASDQWFEEDQDWAAVAIAFPQHFSEEQLFFAVKTIRYSAQTSQSRPKAHLRWLPLIAWLDTPGNPVSPIATRFREEHADFWQVSSTTTDGNAWRVSLRRLRDGARHVVNFIDYPGQTFYNDPDLHVLAI